MNLLELGLVLKFFQLVHMYQWKGKDLFGKNFFAGFSEQVPSRKDETEKVNMPSLPDHPIP